MIGVDNKTKQGCRLPPMTVLHWNPGHGSQTSEIPISWMSGWPKSYGEYGDHAGLRAKIPGAGGFTYLGPGHDHCNKDCMALRNRVCMAYTNKGTNCTRPDCYEPCLPTYNTTDHTGKLAGRAEPGKCGLQIKARHSHVGDVAPVQPLGFLSRAGAEGKRAHILVAFHGIAFGSWSKEDYAELDLSPNGPRHRANLAMASYPLTKLFVASHSSQVFMLQMKEHDEAASVDNLQLEQVSLCGGQIQRTKLTQLQWPESVSRRTDFLCNPYANEEETLDAATPAVLHNQQYGSNQLMLNVNNRVYSYPLSGLTTSGARCPLLSVPCDTCKSTDCVPCKTSRVLKPEWVIANLVGRSHTRDHELTSATTRVVLNRERLSVFSSYNTLQSVDVSLAIPCGRIMDFTASAMSSWKVASGTSAASTQTLSVPSETGSFAQWSCTAMKKVDTVERTLLTKSTVCCAVPGKNAGELGVPCCVRKFADATDLNGVAAERVAAALGAM